MIKEDCQTAKQQFLEGSLSKIDELNKYKDEEAVTENAANLSSRNFKQSFQFQDTLLKTKELTPSEQIQKEKKEMKMYKVSFTGPEAMEFVSSVHQSESNNNLSIKI